MSDTLRAFLDLNHCRKVKSSRSKKVYYVVHTLSPVLLSAVNSKTALPCHFLKKVSKEHIDRALLSTANGVDQRMVIVTVDGILEFLRKTETTRAKTILSHWKAGTLHTLPVVVKNKPWYKLKYAAMVSKNESCQEETCSYEEILGRVDDRQEDETLAQESECRDLVVVKDGIVMADSLGVAEHFEKNHRDVVKKVRQIMEEHPENGLRNFTQAKYNDGTGHFYPMYEMTRDGFSFLVMGFTGKKAGEWKWKYIDAFNAMEAALRDKWLEDKAVHQNDSFSSFLSSHAFERIANGAMTFVATMQQTQLEILKVLQSLVESKEASSIVKPPTHLTVVGYSKMIDVKLDLKSAQAIGRRATRLCHLRNLEVKSVTDEHWEQVNSYPLSVLTEIFADIYHGHVENSKPKIVKLC